MVMARMTATAMAPQVAARRSIVASCPMRIASLEVLLADPSVTRRPGGCVESGADPVDDGRGRRRFDRDVAYPGERGLTGEAGRELGPVIGRGGRARCLHDQGGHGGGLRGAL